MCANLGWSRRPIRRNGSAPSALLPACFSLTLNKRDSLMETQIASINQADLALNGGPKAFPQMEGQPQPKIGVAEFLSIAERFGFSPEALERIRSVISDEDLGRGPNLAKYSSSYPPETKG